MFSRRAVEQQAETAVFRQVADGFPKHTHTKKTKKITGNIYVEAFISVGVNFSVTLGSETRKKLTRLPCA